MKVQTDFIIDNQRSVFAVRPVSRAAKAWIEDNVGGDVPTFGNSVVVEHRFIEALVDGFTGDGLTFEAA